MNFWQVIVRDYSELVQSLFPNLCKDETGEPILRTKKIEISMQSEHELRLYVRKRGSTYKQLKKARLILKEQGSDEKKFHIVFSDMKHLHRIAQVRGLYKRRPNISGKKAKERGVDYGHAYIPYRPNVDKSTDQQLGILETAAREARQENLALVEDAADVFPDFTKEVGA
jgi:hypothetical protein